MKSEAPDFVLTRHAIAIFRSTFLALTGSTPDASHAPGQVAPCARAAAFLGGASAKAARTSLPPFSMDMKFLMSWSSASPWSLLSILLMG